jgi:hypothetical protein
VQNLDAENNAVLDLVAAMCGLIGPNFRAISFDLDDRRLILRFVLYQDQPADREAISWIIAEYDGLQSTPMEIYAEIFSESESGSSIPHLKRLVLSHRLGDEF